jgi:hypothetical protein
MLSRCVENRLQNDRLARLWQIFDLLERIVHVVFMGMNSKCATRCAHHSGFVVNK